MQRLETAPSSSSGKLIMDRYMADRPSNKQEKDEEVQYFSVIIHIHKHSVKLPSVLKYIWHSLTCSILPSTILQAWIAAVDNVKTQMLHQENRLMNAELAEGGLGSLWLQQNATIDQVSTSLFYFHFICALSVRFYKIWHGDLGNSVFPILLRNYICTHTFFPTFIR